MQSHLCFCDTSPRCSSLLRRIIFTRSTRLRRHGVILRAINNHSSPAKRWSIFLLHVISTPHPHLILRPCAIPEREERQRKIYRQQQNILLRTNIICCLHLSSEIFCMVIRFLASLRTEMPLSSRSQIGLQSGVAKILKSLENFSLTIPI